MGRIPPEGTSFEHEGVRYTVTSAEPQKVNRVKIELPVKEAAGAGARAPAKE
jgi:CBS domain containing-hemolysin-like protein